ncbi:MAG: hypothetical protein RLZZ31_342 [Actinomycetota bacterium]|jgi:ribulose-5-phosphate 4-epimerase/fuculose-1-phosphate aldolase
MTASLDPDQFGVVRGSAKPIPYEIPAFNDVAEERLYRKQRLAAAFRLFGKFGFGEGVAGHITVRDPEFPDRFWLNPIGVDFRLMRVSDLVCVNHYGEILHGVYSINQAAFAIHSQVHKHRPDVVAAAHTHSVYGKAFSSLGKLLDPITQDACQFYNDHVLFDDFTGVVLDPSEGERICEVLGNKKAAILRNHGLLTTGQSVDEAAWWYITMERSCQAQLLAMAAGNPISIDHEAATLTHSQIGHPFAGWFSFQPLYSVIVREEPDLFD